MGDVYGEAPALNYRHAFHAGNFADVMKHAVLARLICHLKQKPGAFRVIDTHAGAGLYSLTGDEARRSPEWRQGIERLLQAEIEPRALELLSPYLDVVSGENSAHTLARYPGSPLIVRRLLRVQDRLSALELHPQDATALSALFAGDVQVRVSQLDGWLALNAFVPAKERRGLVLIDPPFEVPGEFERLVSGLVKAYRKWATGLYMLWYPLKSEKEISGFHAALRATAIPKMLGAELFVDRLDGEKLAGSGLILVNPPFGLEDELRVVLPAMATALGGGHGGHRLAWVRGET